MVRSTGGELDANNKFIDSTKDIPDVLFSIQPFTPKTTSVVLPEGIRSDRAYVLFSFFEIKEADQFAKTKADRVNIKGHDYVAYSVEDWSFHGSNADHYESVFVREDTISQFKAE